MIAHRHNESSQISNNCNYTTAASATTSGTASGTTTTTTTVGYPATNEELCNVLCSHDGVLLKKASAEYMNLLNSYGTLSLLESTSPRRLYIEWQQILRPNEKELIDTESVGTDDWSLVDTITKRTRTTSECEAFNIKPPDDIAQAANANKQNYIRTQLEEFSGIEIKHRKQTIRFIRKSDDASTNEFFFQHGNFDKFVNSLTQLHIIEMASANSCYGDKYVILNNENQKLRKTFDELNIGDIKASTLGNENSLSYRVFGFLANIPDYVPLQKSTPKVRPGTFEYSGAHDESYKNSSAGTSTSDNYQLVNFNPNCSSDGSSSNEKSPDSEMENIKEVDEKLINVKLPERQSVQRGQPLSEKQWQEFKTNDGRISDPARLREIIFNGGIAPELRAEVWKYLLNYYQWSDSSDVLVNYRLIKKKEYYTMKCQWLSMTVKQEQNFTGYRDRKCQIEKDCKRTDRTMEFFAGEDNPNLQLMNSILMTYVMYNFDLGYVQGMSDLLAPILEIQRDEVDAFWCFVGFMDMVFANFDVDQAGMKTQFNQLRALLEFVNPRFFNYIRDHDSDNMYFCFRWLLVWFKREFNNNDVLKIWECLWTRLPCPNFQLLISVAILDQQTDVIIENNYEFTGILKHVNELSGNINLKRTLEIAESIYHQIKAADDLPNNIRLIIGEPVIETHIEDSVDEDLDDHFDDLIRELTPEEQRRQQEELEEACEHSMSFQFL